MKNSSKKMNKSIIIFKKLNNLMKKEWFIILLLLIITRFFLILAGDLAYTWIEENPEDLPKQEFSDNKFLAMWYRWDAAAYYHLSTEGYTNHKDWMLSEYAFFPLLPLIVGFLSKITGEVLITGLLFSNLMLFLSLIMLLKLLKQKFSDELSNRAILFVLIFPSTLFLSLLYTESLFIFLTVSGFYALTKNKFMIAGICGALLSATRPVGIFFFIGALVYYWYNNKKEWKSLNWLWLFLSPLGLFLYMFYLKIIAGSSTAFLFAQENFRRNISIGTYDHFISVLRLFTDFSLGNFVNMSFFMLAVISLIWCWKYWDKGLAIFGLLCIAAPLMTATLYSMNRFVLTVIPIYVFLAWLGNNKLVEKSIIIGGSVLMAIWTALFVNWYWIA